MSLLQFAKNNKEYLNLFNGLTANDSRIRSKTVSSIITQLNNEKAKTKDIEELQSTALIKYTLQRLIRGLTSSKHSNRIAFANTFSQVLTHCKWLTTAFILQTVHAFCEHEKAKQSTIIESLLLIRNLLILILFQTHRLYELSWDDLHTIITNIVHSKQAKNLIDLSCQSMICLLNIMEKDNDDATNSETAFKTLLIEHRIELLKAFSQLIPSPINSFKLISITQIKLILRIYSHHHHSTTQWTFDEDQMDNKTIQILPTKIALVYEFVLKPLKQPPSSSSSSLSSLMNIYNDDKMWHSLICLFCNAEDKQQRNIKFGKCCDAIFYFVNQNMLKPKYVSLVSVLCDVFIRYGVALKISNETLFTHVLRPAILTFITKYGLKYKHDTQCMSYKKAFDFMMELKLLSTHSTYGSRMKSILESSSITRIGRVEKDQSDSANDSKLKTLTFYEKVFWRENAFIHENKRKFKNQLLASERDCVTSIKSISNVLQQFVQNNGRQKDGFTLQHLDKEWIKAGLAFMVRVVFFKRKTDIFNRSRFENIWLTAKRLLRILLQTAWHVLPSTDAKDKLNRKVFIGLVNEAIESFKEDDALSYRSKNIMAMDAAQMSLKGITQMTDAMDQIKQKYLSAQHKRMLSDAVRFVGVYYYMDDASITVSILKHLRHDIMDEISALSSVQFGSKLLDIVVESIQSDDMFVSCVSRHVFLAFGDLYNSDSLEKLLRFISTEEEEEEPQNEEEKDDKEEEEEESESESDSEDMDSDDEDMEDSDASSSDSDEFDITDYGAFGGEGDIDLEGETVQSEELEQMDQALIAVFREKQKQSVTRVNAKKSRIQKRVFHHLLLFVKEYKTSPLLLIMLTPLMMFLWKLFDAVTNDYQKAKNKQNKKQNEDNDSSKVAPKMRTMHGVPLWRFDNKLKRSWNDYTAMLDKTSKKQQNKTALSSKSKHFHSAVTVIEGILSHSAKLMVEADGTYNEIQLEWVKDIVYDIIELSSQSPTYEHEMLSVKVLCYLCKVYQMKCNQRMDHEQIWNHLKLNHEEEEEEEEDEMDGDVSWLFELWYIQLKLLMKQPRRMWYFSREFFDVFMRKNAFVVWKLIYEALDAFEVCKNAWSRTQLFVLIGNMTSYCGGMEEEEMQWILKGVAKRMVVPLKESLDKSMDPTKKMLIAQNAGKLVRRLNKYKIETEEKKEIMNALGNSKLQWKKNKTKTKKYKKSVTKSVESKKGKQTKKRKMAFKKKGNKKSFNPKKKRKLN